MMIASLRGIARSAWRARAFHGAAVRRTATEPPVGAASEDIPSFFNKLPEKLILESNGMKPTTAENQLDTLRYYKRLRAEGFSSQQTNYIIQLLLSVLNEQFFDHYNSRFLRNMELENQSHLFHAAESELRYSIQNSRESAINEQSLQLMKLNRELHVCRDELNELLINLLQKDSRVDFSDHKSENTLLQRDINIRLRDCNNRIGTKIIGQIKFDIENLRWQTTRSGLFAVLILVFFIMSGASISRRIAAEHDKPVEVVLHTVEPEERELDDLPLADEQLLKGADLDDL
ncbi:AGR282Wp [Eremothecium gossypii ATCC 10895]|uniref:AGR282Wp n=1 Tax=Eremothecium gossypii (strain ATCC 10895 / CBS 109.51 / FGSC 9923 / NRRL Y-1056) TaxID=284811 RepID=Q74ZB7_EREGS|nr:AGR282Wp [Eremothecium gossypii ATCC 10895]AAS54772.1 AGR282Wp [Eremothecium gossypii ATCC 10895]AEY99103.1 FAGR282Wp [Eremothecium gossypii FDAG1]